MTKQWRVRVSASRRRKPNVELLAAAVLELAKQMQREHDEGARFEDDAATTNPEEQ